MGVKNLWCKALGIFREQDVVKLDSLADKCVVIDTSAWMHKLDTIHEVAYAWTSSPVYAHYIIKCNFEAKYRALEELGITPIFVFDEILPNVKKRESRRCRQNLVLAADQYRLHLENLCTKISNGDIVSDSDRSKLFDLWRKMALPTPENYTLLCQWMDENDFEYVQAPFEADAQMTQLINEGRASAAITEYGDLIINKTF